MELPFLQIQS